MNLYAYIDNDFFVTNMCYSNGFTPINDAQLFICIGIADHWGAITNASNPASPNPIVITSEAHGLSNGQQVLIAEINGNRAANGGFTITVIDANTFSLNGSTGSGAYEDGGYWYLCPNLCCNIPLTYQTGTTGNYAGTMSGNADLTPGVNYVEYLYATNYRVVRGPTQVTCSLPT